MKPSQNCIELIEKFEGFRLEPYLDGAGVPTIGFGSTRYEDGTSVTLDDKAITKAKAEELLLKHIEEVSKNLNKSIKIDLSQNQFDAIVSLVYNIGVGNFNKSTLLKYLNLDNINKAANQFLFWVKVNGSRSNGLVKRRQAEYELFIKP